MNKEIIEKAIKYLEVLIVQNELRYQNNLKAIETTRRQTEEEINRVLVQLDELNKLIYKLQYINSPYIIGV